MELDTPIIVSSAFKTFVWGFLLVQGIRAKLIRRYLFAYIFFATEFSVFWLRTFALSLLGPSDPRYFGIYYGTIIPVDIFALLILLWFY